MCGRAVYSSRAVANAAASFSCEESSEENAPNETCAVGKQLSESNEASWGETLGDHSYPYSTRIPTIPTSGIKDTPNTAPGNEFHVFRRSSSKRQTTSTTTNNNNNNNKNDLECTPMKWGLLPNNGTHHQPHLLPTDPNYSVSPHYKMFNARSETIYDKKSFSGLIRNGQTCIVALEGYYEWTESQSSLRDKRKQPYYVCYKNKQRPLLMAGLWSCVKTGKKIKNANNATNIEDETITTFAIVTTDAHPDYAWLHPRQPVILWDTSIALEWLTRPNFQTVEKLRTIPIRGGLVNVNGETKKEEVVVESIWKTTSLLVYPVSNKMNDIKYQGDDCTTKVKLEIVAPSIKSFFSSSGGNKKKSRIKTKEFNGSDHVSQPPRSAPKIISTTNQCTPIKREQLMSMKKADSHGRTVSIEKKDDEGKSWTCSKCTFIHTGSVKFEYLSCEVCQSERTLDDDGHQESGSHLARETTLEHPNNNMDASLNSADRTRKRKAA